MKDLALLVADKNMRFALKGAIERPAALGIRPVEFEILVHVGRDSGVRKTGHEILRLQRQRFDHALLLLDHEGSGADDSPPGTLEGELDAKLFPTWGDAGKAVVISPELDIWMWGSDDAMRNAIDWRLDTPIRDMVAAEGFTLLANGKPERPKEALECVMRLCRQPRSSILYEKIASRISLARCEDRAFIRLRDHLTRWFPPL